MNHPLPWVEFLQAPEVISLRAVVDHQMFLNSSHGSVDYQMLLNPTHGSGWFIQILSTRNKN